MMRLFTCEDCESKTATEYTKFLMLCSMCGGELGEDTLEVHIVSADLMKAYEELLNLAETYYIREGVIPTQDGRLAQAIKAIKALKDESTGEK